MTAQEIYEREGFLVLYSEWPRELGKQTTHQNPSESNLVPAGTPFVPVAEITGREAYNFFTRNKISTAPWGDPCYDMFNFYKIIAE